MEAVMNNELKKVCFEIITYSNRFIKEFHFFNECCFIDTFSETSKISIGYGKITFIINNICDMCSCYYMSKMIDESVYKEINYSFDIEDFIKNKNFQEIIFNFLDYMDNFYWKIKYFVNNYNNILYNISCSDLHYEKKEINNYYNDFLEKVKFVYNKMKNDIEKIFSNKPYEKNELNFYSKNFIQEYKTTIKMQDFHQKICNRLKNNDFDKIDLKDFIEDFDMGNKIHKICKKKYHSNYFILTTKRYKINCGFLDKLQYYDYNNMYINPNHILYYYIDKSHKFYKLFGDKLSDINFLCGIGDLFKKLGIYDKSCFFDKLAMEYDEY